MFCKAALASSRKTPFSCLVFVYDLSTSIIKRSSPVPCDPGSLRSRKSTDDLLFDLSQSLYRLVVSREGGREEFEEGWQELKADKGAVPPRISSRARMGGNIVGWMITGQRAGWRSKSGRLEFLFRRDMLRVVMNLNEHFQRNAILEYLSS